MSTFTEPEMRKLMGMKTPAQVQDFLDTIPINHERDGVDRVKSPLRTLREGSAHCIEGALLGAYILSLHSHPPLLMLLKTKKSDWNHVVAPFKQHGYWGALSKTNHAVLRYREPVYKTTRELALSYFHEYFLDNGQKTLRSYSKVLNLNTFEDTWPTSEEDLWGIEKELHQIRSYPIARPEVMCNLRLADPLERKAGQLTEWK
ncbi:MAG: hypothetical protein A2542_00940 [Parcubacteria group bacterium RIFOXYD2_FULL_52_8]|nr:MAG: hypothetical protein A2542_00940 [Parcubacteria group bacterium RIFOXYD2_FULL_52_8]